MQLYSIDTGFFKLDGGAMFGVVPKSIWQKTNPADANNMCTWAMRCLLVEDGNRLVLIDTGIGTKQSEKFFSYYFLHGNHTLENSLNRAGFSLSDITDVVLTHLHFDHCGGAITRSGSGILQPTFPNAQYWSNERHWQWATQPNAREKASFLEENITPIRESGQLKMIERGADSTAAAINMEFLFVDGHTDSMMLPLITWKGRRVCFMADLLPSVGHIPLAYVMGYDTRPLITLDEKSKILRRAVDENWVLFFEHDAVNQCASLHETEKGIRANQYFRLDEL
jgi:glyoxylase-like metal-dependent hydrolase (beta-lactamase superfamily II)